MRLWEIFKYKSVTVKKKLNSIDLVICIVKLNEFNTVKKQVEEFGQPSKNPDGENRRLKHSAEILQDPNDVWTYDFFIFLKYK